MSTRKTTNQKLQAELEKRKQIDEQIKQLKERQKAEEEKAKTTRLCKRGRVIEKQLPMLAKFTNEQFEIFAKRVLFTEQTKRIIAEISTH